MRWAAAILIVAATLSGCLGPSGDGPNLEEQNHQPEQASVFPGTYRFDGPGSKPLVDGSLAALPVESVMLTSQQDGADIDMSLWRPDTSDPVPVLVQASPYFLQTNEPFGSQGFGQWVIENFVPHGYAYVQLASRGSANSGGCDDFRGPEVTADLVQATTWLSAQEWNNGAVGMLGLSYPATMQWMVAAAGAPHVKTIIPMAGTPDVWDLYVRNGTPEDDTAIQIPFYYALQAGNPYRDAAKQIDVRDCPQTWNPWITGLEAGTMGTRPDAQWWDKRNLRPGVEANYQGSILLVQGLQDWNVDPGVTLPWGQQLADSGLDVKQILGQWEHDSPDQAEPGREWTKRWDWAEILLRWLDRELKGTDADVGPAVQVQSNDGRWRDEESWPPVHAAAEKFYLGHDQLTRQPSTESSVAFEPVIGAMPTWRLDLDEDLHIAGLPTVHVTVTPDQDGGYLSAFLYDESPDGTQERVGWTGMNFLYYEGGNQSQQVIPGTAIVLKMQIQPMDAVIPAGHALVLELSKLPYADRLVPPQPYSFTLHHGGDHVSQIVLPTIDPPVEAFFQPPLP